MSNEQTRMVRLDRQKIDRKQFHSFNKTLCRTKTKYNMMIDDALLDGTGPLFISYI